MSTYWGIDTDPEIFTAILQYSLLNKWMCESIDIMAAHNIPEYVSFQDNLSPII